MHWDYLLFGMKHLLWLDKACYLREFDKIIRESKHLI